jgi:chloride channel protein, CIC family
MDRQCVDGSLVPGTEQKGNYTATLSASRFACRSPPLVLGEALGRVFGQSIVHAQAIDLYCAIGMAAFIAAGYKTPLGCSGLRCGNHRNTGVLDSRTDRRRGGVRGFWRSFGCSQSKAASDAQAQPTGRTRAREIMRTQAVGAQADATLQEFFANVAAYHRHPVYPVFKDRRAIGTISLWEIAQVPHSPWNNLKVGEVARPNLAQVDPDADLREVVRLMNQHHGDSFDLFSGSLFRRHEGRSTARETCERRGSRSR